MECRAATHQSQIIISKYFSEGKTIFKKTWQPQTSVKLEHEIFILYDDDVEFIQCSMTFGMRVVETFGLCLYIIKLTLSEKVNLTFFKNLNLMFKFR